MTYSEIANRADNRDFQRAVRASAVKTAVQIRNGQIDDTDEYRARQRLAIDVLTKSTFDFVRFAFLVSTIVKELPGDSDIDNAIASIWTACTDYIHVIPEVETEV